MAINESFTSNNNVVNIAPSDFITTYIVNENNMNVLAQRLYDTSLGTAFYDSIMSVFGGEINNLVKKIYVYPFDITDLVKSTESLVMKYRLLNIDVPMTGQNGYRLLDNKTHRLILGVLDLYKPNNFLDYTSTTYKLYLPYHGFIELNAIDILGKRITIEYNLDVANGVCTAYVYASNELGTYIITQLDINIAISLPIANSGLNEAKTGNIKKIVTGAVAIGVGVATGGTTALVGLGVGASTLTSLKGGSVDTSDYGENFCKFSSPTKPQLVITKPRILSSAYDLLGYPDGAIRYMSAFSTNEYVSFNEVDTREFEKHIENSLLNEERESLKNILKGGVRFE